MATKAKKNMKHPEAEPRMKLYKLVIEREFEATDMKGALEQATEHVKMIIKRQLNEEDDVKRIPKRGYMSRAGRLDDIMRRLEEAQGDTESLGEELDEWLNNLPDSFRDGDKGQELEEAISGLSQITDAIAEAIGYAGDVNFPGMY